MFQAGKAAYDLFLEGRRTQGNRFYQLCPLLAEMKQHLGYTDTCKERLLFKCTFLSLSDKTYWFTDESCVGDLTRVSNPPWGRKALQRCNICLGGRVRRPRCWPGQHECQECPEDTGTPQQNLILQGHDKKVKRPVLFRGHIVCHSS